MKEKKNMNQQIKELIKMSHDIVTHERNWDARARMFNKEKFAELIGVKFFTRETLRDAIAQGWFRKKKSHKTMDSNLALAKLKNRLNNISELKNERTNH
jgi:hypothetical protein